MEAAIVVTYRCNAKCCMCNTWKNPTKISEEISPKTLEKLPRLDFCNITGGEPFLREDIADIIAVLKKKSKRIVISTNGFFTDKILALARQHRDIGLRISIEGLQSTNDELRGIKNGFDQGLKTLLELQKIGIKDIGFGITIGDRNCKDMIELYQLAKAMNLEFATAVVHNSHYFHKWDNKINNKEEVIGEFKKLIKYFLKSNKIKDWYRAWFNYGLINYIRGNPRLLPCEMGRDGFFLDPSGDVLACNGMDTKQSMGNLKEKRWNEIWYSKMADEIRRLVKNCPKNCWMIGSVAPAIKRYPIKPTLWVLMNKARVLARKDPLIC